MISVQQSVVHTLGVAGHGRWGWQVMDAGVAGNGRWVWQVMDGGGDRSWQ